MTHWQGHLLCCPGQLKTFPFCILPALHRTTIKWETKFRNSYCTLSIGHTIVHCTTISKLKIPTDVIGGQERGDKQRCLLLLLHKRIFKVSPCSLYIHIKIMKISSVRTHSSNIFHNWDPVQVLLSNQRWLPASKQGLWKAVKVQRYDYNKTFLQIDDTKYDTKYSWCCLSLL